MLDGILDSLYKALIRDDRWKTLVRGLGTTLQIAAVALVAGVILGVLVAVIKVYAVGSKNPVIRVLNVVCNLYTTVIRGTPLVIQLLILFNLQGWFSSLIPCFIGFSLNSGAYVSEIFRGAINSIDPGQMEAGRSLGLTRNQTMLKIVLPQAVKSCLPALFNEFIVLVKETSISGYIAVQDLTKAADLIRGRTFENTSLFIAAGAYLLITLLLTQVLRLIERRLAQSDRR